MDKQIIRENDKRLHPKIPHLSMVTTTFTEHFHQWRMILILRMVSQKTRTLFTGNDLHETDTADVKVTSTGGTEIQTQHFFVTESNGGSGYATNHRRREYICNKHIPKCNVPTYYV